MVITTSGWMNFHLLVKFEVWRVFTVTWSCLMKKWVTKSFGLFLWQPDGFLWIKFLDLNCKMASSSSSSSAPKPGQGVSTQRQIGHCIRWARLMYIVLFLFVFFVVGEESYNNKWNPPASIFIRKIEPIWCWLGKIWWTLPFWELSHIPILKALVKMMFLFQRWDMFAPWRVYQRECWCSPPYQWLEMAAF